MKVRGPHRPPPGRPGWSPPAEHRLELLYLAWGWRRYRDTPQFSDAREGWVYITPRKGAPHLIFKGRRVVLKSGDLAIMDPDCPQGMDDVVGGVSEVCTWVWRSASRWPALRPAPGSYLLFSLPKEACRAMWELHRLTRAEVQHLDEHTQAALEILKLRLDLLLVRALGARAEPSPDEQRLALCLRWIEEHLDNHKPTAGLSEYLLLSPATLNRLFQRMLGRSIRDYAKRRRLERAAEWIEKKNWSVKAAAYSLGYRFPNDLSRALGSVRRARREG